MEVIEVTAVPVSEKFTPPPAGTMRIRCIDGGSSPRQSSGITPRKFGNARPKPDNWLDKALSKDKMREALLVRHGNYATDAYRIHHIPSPAESPCTCGNCPPRMSDILNDAKTGNAGKVIVKRLDVMIACNICDAICHRESDRMILDITPEGIQYKAETWDASTSGGIYARIEGKPITFGINYHFLKDAVSGMADHVTIEYKGATSPVYVTDGKLEAVLMPMTLPESE